ncbi:MAG: topoisomerase DNA-binding C4 zinc finger domain-containing protein [Chloracidobacterium sp.]|nr:topoisomerase DNA-binding C4 zinc finger domain-containing protein [Chloracidobacterium sp.]
MVIKFGRFGQFLACANYPECKNTREVGTKRAGSDGDPGGPRARQPKPKRCRPASFAERRWLSRKGDLVHLRLHRLSRNARTSEDREGRPEAAGTTLSHWTTRPKDGANLVRRHGRFGEFISCSNYPKCDFVN